MAIVYRTEKLTKIYKKSDKKANDELSLDIQEGEIFGLLGPNGAGKSTLVNQLAGLLRPTSGKIQLFGIDIASNPSVVPTYVALQPQQVDALNALSAEEALLFTARLRGISSGEAQKQARALIEELAMEPLLKKPLRRLSGGQRKLVDLAITFIGNKPVQIFDEPTNELDPQVRRVIWDKLLTLNGQGTTIILVTHNVLEAERVIQRVGIINHGRLFAIGSPSELKARVDQHVKLELNFKPEAEGYQKVLEALGNARSLTPLLWTIQCEYDKVRSLIDQVLFQVGLHQLNDFRITTPSLEDVYLQLGGGMSLE